MRRSSTSCHLAAEGRAASDGVDLARESQPAVASHERAMMTNFIVQHDDIEFPG
jgi:hypothetical protein